MKYKYRQRPPFNGKTYVAWLLNLAFTAMVVSAVLVFLIMGFKIAGWWPVNS